MVLTDVQVPMMPPQAKEWRISLVDATRSLSGNTAVCHFAYYFRRQPVHLT
jgi:hypothetical protein